MSQALLSESEWRAVFEQQRSSGQSVAAFCRRVRVPQSSFFYWRRKLEQAPVFTELKLAAEPEPGSVIEVLLPCGRSLRVRPGFCRRTLLELLATLEHSGGAGAVNHREPAR